MSALFHQNVVVAVLGSGSRGNCTYVGDGRSGVLIDCGLSTRQVMVRLETLGLADAPIDAVLITHEHADHVGAAAILDRALQKRSGAAVPFFMTPGTAESLHPKVVPSRIEKIASGAPFRLGSVRVEPVSIPHDTLDPVAYCVELGPTRVGVITDLGRSTRLVEQKLASLDIAVLEFNHDVQLLLDGSYPWALKQRIRGPHGHLSNDQAAELLTRGASSRLSHVVLAHLSDENNRPDHALRAADRALMQAGRREVTVHLGRQDVATAIVAHKPLFEVAGAAAKRRPARATHRPHADAELQQALFRAG